jgi:uncharacterized protein YceH (UPF0502 family)
VELTAAEIRVLGCLAEKEATTPDIYPLSTNGLRTACNQQSSRDPVVDYDESTVTATLIALREHGLVRTMRGEGSRVYKHAHLLRERLDVDPAGLAVLSVLMLRGPQTPGELRTRTERQHAFTGVDEVEAALEGLAGRESPLVALLPRQPGQREARWTHLLGAGETAVAPPQPSLERRAPRAAAPADSPDELARLREELAELRTRLEALERRLGAAPPAGAS